MTIDDRLSLWRHHGWQIEVYPRDLKIALKMDVLRCKTEQGVLKELAAFALVYNLVRSVACETAQRGACRRSA